MAPIILTRFWDKRKRNKNLDKYNKCKFKWGVASHNWGMLTFLFNPLVLRKNRICGAVKRDLDLEKVDLKAILNH